jgi:hypothetical protein
LATSVFINRKWGGSVKAEILDQRHNRDGGKDVGDVVVTIDQASAARMFSRGSVIFGRW